MEKLLFYLTAVVVFMQMASVAGRMYNDRNVAGFRCTPQSPVRRPDIYRLTTGGVTVYFPLTHVFCGEVRNGLAKGFHSTAAPQSSAQKSAIKVGRTMARIYNANRREYTAPKFSTFFHPSLTVKGLSNCISTWAAVCYNNNNYARNCMHLTNIPYLYNGIEVYFRRQGRRLVTLTTAYPSANRITSCIRCQIPRNHRTCNLRQ